MKKINLKKIAIFLLTFVIALLVGVGEGYYRKALANESAAFNVALSGKGAKAITFDVAKEGLPKKIAQPGKISISTGHGAGIKNDTKEEIALQVKAEGFPYDVQVTSTDTSFNAETGEFSKALKPGSAANLSLILDIPRNKLSHNKINTGNLKFTDGKSGKVIAQIPVNIINSSVTSKE